MKRKLITIALLLLTIASAQQSLCQTTTDGFMMDKGNLCLVGDYSHDSWKNYWEGTKKRESHYVGTFNSNSVTTMFGLGITDKILLTGSLPYIWTNSTEFYNTGQKGFQDLTGGLKWKAITKDIKGGSISLFPAIAASIPVSDYIPDMLPYSIGIQSKTFSAGGVVDYSLDKGFYVTFNWGYVWRSNINIDATSYYYDERLYYSDELFIPDLIVYGAQLGYDVERFRAEAWLRAQSCQGGTDIRPNDKPYPFNRMSYAKVGVSGKYNLKQIANLSVVASAGYTVEGRNVGQSFLYSAGVQYIFKIY